MNKTKKITKISPEFIKDKSGKATSVLLKFSVYKSILDEMDDLKKSIQDSKKKSLSNKK